jgi:hypothetical protein
MLRRAALCFALVSAVCLAQGPRGGRGSPPGSRGVAPPTRSAPPAAVRSVPLAPGFTPIGQGFGNIVMPGGVPNPFYSNATTFAQRFGSVMTGYPGYIPGTVGRGAVGWGTGGRRGGGLGFGGVPLGIPMFVGGGFGYTEPQPNITIVNAPPTQPSVIINQNYTPDRAVPVVRDYTAEELPEPGGLRSYQAPVPSFPEGTGSGRLRAAPSADKPTIYLIAFKDGVVYSCYAFWVEGETLHYITTKYAHNRASVELIDADVSRQLNDERGVDFALPPVD